MNEKCYCGGDKVEPERHANCWRAYVAGLRRALAIDKDTERLSHAETIQRIRAEIESAERGRG